MRPIIIGAGRGSRLNALTDNQPKCFAPVGKRRILDWLLEALTRAGLDTPVFIGGYQIELLRAEYPKLEFVHNDAWPSNNILASLFYAEEYMDGGFVCSYADILYRPNVVRRALEHPGDIVLCVDTQWRQRYKDRSQHPEDDAEKVIAEGDKIVRIDRTIAADQASGEYIGVARLSVQGAAWLRQYYHQARATFSGRVWRDNTQFEKAYLIHLFESMRRQGVPLHMVTTDGDYMEIDTEEDFALANARWPQFFAE
jgi:choline kinase